MAADPSGRYPRAPVREPRGAGASVSPEDTPVKISGRGNSGKGRGVTPDRCAHGERGDELVPDEEAGRRLPRRITLRFDRIAARRDLQLYKIEPARRRVERLHPRLVDRRLECLESCSTRRGRNLA